jgi:hypothetical protein
MIGSTPCNVNNLTFSDGFISPPLSLWERARVRAENGRACTPHPKPPPKGEGTKNTVL